MRVLKLVSASLLLLTKPKENTDLQVSFCDLQIRITLAGTFDSSFAVGGNRIGVAGIGLCE